jgi:hypothetical protein
LWVRGNIYGSQWPADMQKGSLSAALRMVGRGLLVMTIVAVVTSNR